MDGPVVAFVDLADHVVVFVALADCGVAFVALVVVFVVLVVPVACKPAVDGDLRAWDDSAASQGEVSEKVMGPSVLASADQLSLA